MLVLKPRQHARQNDAMYDGFNTRVKRSFSFMKRHYRNLFHCARARGEHWSRNIDITGY